MFEEGSWKWEIGKARVNTTVYVVEKVISKYPLQITY